MQLLIRWAMAGLGLFAAAYLVPGIQVADPNAWTIYALMALILGLVNALIRPILRLLSCPLIILTLGLFLLVINGLSLLIAARIAENLGVGFYVDTFFSAFLGGLIVSAASLLGTMLFREQND